MGYDANTTNTNQPNQHHQQRFMPAGDGRGRVPETSYMAGNTGNNRRNQQQQQRRSPYGVGSSDNAQASGSQSYVYPQSATTSYNPNPRSGPSHGFYGQYTMSPPTMGMTPVPHSPPYPFAPPPPHGYHQNIHAATYQSMMSPYSYQHQHQQQQRHSPPDSGTGAYPSSPTQYVPANPGQFHSLPRYPSPHAQYPYSTPPPFSPYQSQFNLNLSPAQYQSDGQWWYMAPMPPQPQHQYGETGYPYHHPHQLGYAASQQPQQQQAELDPSFTYPRQSSPAPAGSSQHVSVSPSPPPDPPPPPPPPASLPPSVPTHPPPLHSLPTSKEKGTMPTRRSYHPNPPAHRSEWVMWSGNVPSDATHDELWRFFNQPPTTPSPGSTSSSTSQQLASYQHNLLPASSSSPVPGHDQSQPNDHLRLAPTHPGGSSPFQPAPTPNTPTTSIPTPTPNGVISIFLISRSSCAFINYASQAHLEAAIARFNGVPLRPNDPRCPRLVCRVRKRDDDLKAGVGGQRGVGMHSKWVKDSQGRDKDRRVSLGAAEGSGVSGSDMSTGTPSVSDLSEADIDFTGGRKRDVTAGGHSNSSGSYASTNSSMLVKYFPKRYFILKSLSQYDLDLSVSKGLWATQKHNEGILDQAYRTSAEVYLIFGVNKSGEFYGWGKMAGSVKQGEHRVSWGPRSSSNPNSSASASSLNDASSSASASPVTGRGPVQTEVIYEEEPASPTTVLQRLQLGSGGEPKYFTNRMVEDSPQPVTGLTPSPGASMLQSVASPGASALRGGVGSSSGMEGSMEPRDPEGVTSAPPELGERHKKITAKTPSLKFSLDNQLKVKAQSVARMESFELDDEAPLKAIRNSSAPNAVSPTSPPKSSTSKGKAKATGIDQDPDSPASTWGESFKVEWICVHRLPFYKTRHLRNPWNHDREIKVSRDGTELEPGVGEQLLEEWKKFVEEGGGKEGGDGKEGEEQKSQQLPQQQTSKR
ncbi:hypothetical protein VNI00_003630 [Paramarasmius palmivorus]|uniref:YTH domain-containing protein n=1 Tax=Paramarasmius palmivorus TaxID=297713 RepID=A0AAW0DU96_9AGAR